MTTTFRLLGELEPQAGQADFESKVKSPEGQVLVNSDKNVMPATNQP
jgi:hypothetical protein